MYLYRPKLFRIVQLRYHIRLDRVCRTDPAYLWDDFSSRCSRNQSWAILRMTYAVTKYLRKKRSSVPSYWTGGGMQWATSQIIMERNMVTGDDLSECNARQSLTRKSEYILHPSSCLYPQSGVRRRWDAGRAVHAYHNVHKSFEYCLLPCVIGSFQG